MSKMYLLIDYMIETGTVFQVKCFHDREKAIEEGKRSLEYDYGSGFIKKHYKKLFHDYPSLEEVIDQWERQDYDYYGYLEILESEVYD